MSGMSFGLIVEGMVSVLLLVTIIYCLVVNRKLSALRADQAKLKEVVIALDRSTRNAENIMGELRETAMHTQEELDERIEYGRSTLNRLNSVVSEANNILSELPAKKVAAVRYSGPPEMPAEKLTAAPPPELPRKAQVNPPENSSGNSKVKTQLRLSNLMRGNASQAKSASSVKRETRKPAKGAA